MSTNIQKLCAFLMLDINDPLYWGWEFVCHFMNDVLNEDLYWYYVHSFDEVHFSSVSLKPRDKGQDASPTQSSMSTAREVWVFAEALTSQIQQDNCYNSAGGKDGIQSLSRGLR